MGRICAASPDFNLAKQWIKDCNKGHLHCKDNRTHLAPSRLIHIDKSGLKTRLIKTNISQNYEHITLSYRWGTNVYFLTKRDNYCNKLIDIPIGDLPLTFRDTVFATSRLGFQYLWIDSLYII